MKTIKKVFYRKTNRLEIRPLTSSDYQAWKLAYSGLLPPKNIWDKAVRKTSAELTKAEFKILIKDQAQRRKSEDFCDYGIFLISTGEYIGRVSLMSFVRSITQSAFLGYALFNSYWGKGYAEEAVRALIDIAFRDHKLHRVVAGIEPQNIRSRRLIKKLKFRKEGRSEKVVYIRNQWQDLDQYALTTEDIEMNWKGDFSSMKV